MVTRALAFALFALQPTTLSALACKPLPPLAAVVRHFHHPPSRRSAVAARPRRTGAVAMFGGGGPGGGFLNLGAPEVIVIGAIAWVLLGPKELFRLSREAGAFLGQWQQLGQQAKNQFQAALESELAEETLAKAKTATASVTEAFKSPPPPPPAWLDETKWGDVPPAAAAAAASASGGSSSSSSSSSSGGGSSLTDIPPLSEYAAARAKGASAPDTLSDAEKAALRESLVSELGEPSANAAKFAEQISGARNAAVLSEYPAELAWDEPATPAPADGSPLDVQSTSEALLGNQIAEAENRLQMLKAEQSILAMKRKQLEANAARAQRMAEERLAAAEKALAAAELTPQEEKTDA